MKNNKIIIAVPRGRILNECKAILSHLKFAPNEDLFDENSRKLTFSSQDKNIDFIKVRAFDVCTFVAFGAAHIGIAGDDVIQEFNYSEVYAPLDFCALGFTVMVSLPWGDRMWSLISRSACDLLPRSVYICHFQLLCMSHESFIAVMTFEFELLALFTAPLR